MVRPPSDVSACPSPTLAGQVVWSQSLAPPAAPVWGALMGSLVRHSVALASCRPSPSVVLAWVSSFCVCSGLGWKAAVLSWFLPSLGGCSPSIVLVVSLGGSYCLVVQAL